MKYPDIINNNPEPPSKAEEPMMATYMADSPHKSQQPLYDMAYVWKVISSLSTEQKKEVVGRLVEEEATKAKFDSLYAAWLDETLLSSSTSVIRGNKNFKAIVSMGKRAVPYILSEIRSQPSHLCWALTEIYGRSISSKPVTNAEACRLWIKELNGL